VRAGKKPQVDRLAVLQPDAEATLGRGAHDQILVFGVAKQRRSEGTLAPERRYDELDPRADPNVEVAEAGAMCGEGFPGFLLHACDCRDGVRLGFDQPVL
jgi:hypothetical protein